MNSNVSVTAGGIVALVAVAAAGFVAFKFFGWFKPEGPPRSEGGNVVSDKVDEVVEALTGRPGETLGTAARRVVESIENFIPKSTVTNFPVDVAPVGPFGGAAESGDTVGRVIVGPFGGSVTFDPQVVRTCVALYRSASFDPLKQSAQCKAVIANERAAGRL